MQLDIYLMDAADIDQGPNCASDIGLPAYGSLETPWFQKRFPHGFDPLAELAKSFNCRLGVWMGPDGYGKTPEEALKRKEMLVKFCKDYNFALFKFDACCSEGSLFAFMVGDGKIVAAINRAPSFPYNNWEHYGIADKNLTFYIPLDDKLEGKTVQVILLTTDGKLQEMKPEVWLSNPNIYDKVELKLE